MSIITISRGSYSRGRDVAEKLAEHPADRALLSIPLDQLHQFGLLFHGQVDPFMR